MGPVTTEFERRFAAMIGVKHAFAVTNCTAALHLAHVALGVGPGDTVLCPSLPFVATANAIRYTGATPVFVDITSATDLNLAQTQHLNHEPPTVWNTLLSNKLWRGDAFEHREHLLGVREAKTSVAPSGVYPAC